MNAPAETPRSSLAIPLLGGILFAVALTQPAVFYSNQNQYFLHGLAEAGWGDLSNDWLAGTKDPTPVFSWAVSKLYPLTGPWGVHAVFFGMAVTYFLSLWSIIARTRWNPRTTAAKWTLTASLIAIHAGATRWASVSLFGLDYPWFFQAGVANQYILGGGLQPSVFGIFLLSAIGCFAHGRLIAAAIALILACSLHSTYLLPGAMLVAGMMVRLAVDQGLGRAIRFGALVLLGILPVTIAAAIQFRPTDAATFAEGQRIIAWVRIPHHCDVARWLDPIAWLQIGWVILAVAALRKSGLGLALAVAVSLSVGLSLIQIATHHTSLALLFPWRLSAVLVPLATAVVVAMISSVVAKMPATISLTGSALIILAGVIGAERVASLKLAYQVSGAEDGLQRHVAENRKPGELYLLPAGFPKPPAKPGSPTASFVPVSQTGRPAVFELQRFRLITGACGYVDFKSIPYADTDVIEWLERVNTAIRWYGTADWDASGVLEEVRAAGITHVVVPDGVTVKSVKMREAYADGAYRVLRIE